MTNIEKLFKIYKTELKETKGRVTLTIDAEAKDYSVTLDVQTGDLDTSASYGGCGDSFGEAANDLIENYKFING